MKCKTCNQVFPSKSKLFDHIKQTGHAATKTTWINFVIFYIFIILILENLLCKFRYKVFRFINISISLINEIWNPNKILLSKIIDIIRV